MRPDDELIFLESPLFVIGCFLQYTYNVFNVTKKTKKHKEEMGKLVSQPK